ncbi:MAG: hypothetical protein P8Y93_11470 [Acidobacteriota bacterium]
MENMRFGRVIRVLILTGVLPAVVASALGPEGVSPGSGDRVLEIAGRCPTFSWEVAPEAVFIELVAYRLPIEQEFIVPSEVDLALADEVLYARMPGRATTWTPSLEQCLEPGGAYAWFVRAVVAEESEEKAAGSGWSTPRFFAISPRPSAAELDEALNVLRRYRPGEPPMVESAGVLFNTVSNREYLPASERASPASSVRTKSVTGAATAIKGTRDEASGETYGVVGISASVDGAGLGAANVGGGADLVLDGAAEGQADAILTQGGLDRPSAAPQVFNIHNSLGSMTLQVDGVPVGDITSVGASGGLTGGGAAGDVVLSIEDGGITGAKLSDPLYFTGGQTFYGYIVVYDTDLVPLFGDGILYVSSNHQTAIIGNVPTSQPGHGVSGYGSIGVSGEGPVAGVRGIHETERGNTGFLGRPMSGVRGESDAFDGVTGESRAPAGKGGRFVNMDLDGSSNQVGLWAGTYYNNIIEGHDLASDGSSIDRRFYVDRTGNVHADGTYYGAAFLTGSADLAELVPSGEAHLEPADVLAIGPDGRMVRTSTAFQRSVAGVYATEPGFIGGAGESAYGDSMKTDRIPLAVVGIVPTKVTAENGAIRPGDLLVATSTPGHAMRGGDDPPNGSVIGKALEALDGDAGQIRIMVVMQ